ncbi:MAG TPA: SemiSWEET family transporter [Gammaproteobacteria bacterium]|jgi:MtN3 and saliva related transmembrane protein|nr:SemiSWEET family transporter [Gammaproteobacteria bacterium]
MITIESIFGSVAFITSFVGLLPQAYKAFKTRSTEDISSLMIMNYLVCSVAWLVYGACINSAFVILSNAIGLIGSLILIYQKRHYDRKATV